MITFDFHSHVLPGADHGARSRQEAYRLLTAAKQAGIETIIATPHFYPHRHNMDGFLGRRDAAYGRLSEFSQQDLPQILVGAEVLACSGIDRMKGLERLTIEGTKCLLLEMPFVQDELTDDLFDTVERLIDEQKYFVFMAHPNRYPDFCVERMVEMGARLQLNLDDLCSFGEGRRAKRWIEAGYVYAVGSDVHNNEKIYKKLKKAEKLLAPVLDRVNNPLSL